MVSPKFVSLLIWTVAVCAAITPKQLEERDSGFVTRSGRGFVLNGQTFYFMGTNAYWADTISSGDLNSLFSQMNSAGMKVLRIFGWGDNVGGPQGDSFQYWSGSNNTPNPSAFSAHMDPIISAAESAGIKLVIPMIGNWGGSINTYIQQCAGSSAPHDAFFWNSCIINAYKKYVKFFVNRYINSPAIFAWELMNEPNCNGDDHRSTSSKCTAATVTAWVKTMSEYIKSIDPKHMVTVGDEGWLTPAQGYGSSSPYVNHGIDWVTNLKLDSIDYGTIHLYPGSWGQQDSWGSTWITQHGKQADIVGKPVVLEEFGTGSGNRYNTINSWLNAAYSANFNGIQYWQFVGSFPSGYRSPDDGNGISTSESTYSLIKAMAVKMNAKSGKGASAPPSSSSTSTPTTSFRQTTRTLSTTLNPFSTSHSSMYTFVTIPTIASTVTQTTTISTTVTSYIYSVSTVTATLTTAIYHFSTATTIVTSEIYNVLTITATVTTGICSLATVTTTVAIPTISAVVPIPTVSATVPTPTILGTGTMPEISGPFPMSTMSSIDLLDTTAMLTTSGTVPMPPISGPTPSKHSSITTLKHSTTTSSKHSTKSTKRQT